MMYTIGFYAEEIDISCLVLGYYVDRVIRDLRDDKYTWYRDACWISGIRGRGNDTWY